MPARTYTRFAANKTAELIKVCEESCQPEVVIFLGAQFRGEDRILRKAWPQAEQLAIEAHPSHIVAANKTVPTTHAAVVETECETVALYHRAGKTKASSIYPRRARRGGRSREGDAIMVPTITLDQFCDQRKLQGKKTFLWMDCEGSECAALRGGKRILEFVDWIHLEVCVRDRRIKYPDQNELQSLLADNGYETVIDYYQLDWPVRSGDMLYRRGPRRYKK